MDFETMRRVETCVLKLSGKWTVERAHELRSLLLNALKGHEQVLLELEGLMEVDISCLQLLCSAHRSSVKLGKRLALHGNRPETFGQVVRDAGFARALGFLRLN